MTLGIWECARVDALDSPRFLQLGFGRAPLHYARRPKAFLEPHLPVSDLN